MESYQLDTGKKYIKDIFAAEFFYCVPEYQRPYVWTTEHVQTLLDDLKSAFDIDHKKEYFIGSMIWNTKKSTESDIQYTYQDILDGQQRFITFYLLHGVVRDISNNTDLHKKVMKRLLQEEDEFDGIPKRNRIVFEIRDDRDFLDQFLLRKNGTKETKEIAEFLKNNDSKSVHNMSDAIGQMHKWFSEELDEFISESEQQAFINKFFAYISNRVLALYLATPDNLDDAYNLFTVLNSRGMQLQISDILRAQNLRVIGDKEMRKKYAEKWSGFENLVSDPYRTFDDFLWSIVFMRMKYRSDDNKSLTKAFDFMYGRGLVEKGEDTFKMVGNFVNQYDAIVNSDNLDGVSGALFRNLVEILNSVFGSAYLAPVMYYRSKFGDYRIVDFLVKIDNLLSMIWLTGKRSMQTRFFIIMRRMDDHHQRGLASGVPNKAADDFLDSDCLKYDYDDEKASTKLDLDEFMETLRTEDWGSFAGSKINKTRYLLLKLDLIHANINSLINFNRANSSVEHVFPRQPKSENWPGTNKPPESLIHCLGNIVIIDRKKNSSLSNGSYSDKKKKYQSSIECRPYTNYVFMNYDSWNMDTIAANKDRVLTLLKSYYSGNSEAYAMKIIESDKNSPQLSW